MQKSAKLHSRRFESYHLLQSFNAPIVYRLGHQIFILRSGVRLPVGVPVFSADGSAWCGRLPVTQDIQRGSIPLSVANSKSPGGGMADTVDSKSTAARRASSTLARGTKHSR